LKSHRLFRIALSAITALPLSLLLVSVLLLPSLALQAAEDAKSADAKAAGAKPGDAKSGDAKSGDAKPASAAEQHFAPEQQTSRGSVTIDGRRVDYDAYAGTLVVHPKGWDDVPQNAPKDEDKNPRPEASMFYVAYFKSAGKASDKGQDTSADERSAPPRPVTFIFNGGPGSSTVWLHMGAFGPRRVLTADDSHTPAAPYTLVNNEFSLLDASDLVFIDAPGTGFSRIAGTDRDKAFYGVDQDAHAFADFIVQFLSKYGRWNSPKYLFGESYGTTRAAVLVAQLETEHAVDFNGVILLSQILNFDASPDGPQTNPGVDLPYVLALPTYAAAAWYHHKLPGSPPDLAALLTDVEHFATNDYALALAAGSALPAAQRDAIAARLHDYTGLPVSYILKADLRINGGEFEHTLLGDADLTTGRLDSRFSGPSMDPLSKEADYDPQSAAISSAYVSSFNDYVRKDLKYGQDKAFKPEIEIEKGWNFAHQTPGGPELLGQSVNVMPDLAVAMKYNPGLHVMLNSGYFDIATPFYEGIYEMQHLPIPATLQKNIEYAQYQSGHMVYAHEPSLKELHARVADFIRHTQGSKSP
jgi:carboxypeptidase C (cathepsin A)